MIISRCCRVNVLVENAVTCYYVCGNCSLPCDTVNVTSHDMEYSNANV